MVIWRNQPIGIFLDELAGAASTPGGGGAAALSGAMGAGLVSMVCNLTIGKPRFAEVEEEVRDILAESEILRVRLTELIEKDAEAVNRVMAAYRMPKKTDEEKATRSAAIQEGVKAATLIPLTTAEACANLIELSKSAIENGNPNVVSDAEVGVLCAKGGLKSAALIVLFNLDTIKDEVFVARHRAALDEILAKQDDLAEEIYELVKGKL